MYDFLRKEVTNNEADFVNPILHKGRGNMVRIEKIDEEGIHVPPPPPPLPSSSDTEKEINIIVKEKEEGQKEGWYPGKYFRAIWQKKE